jgi:hypothetical protein
MAVRATSMPLCSAVAWPITRGIAAQRMRRAAIQHNVRAASGATKNTALPSLAT